MDGPEDEISRSEIEKTIKQMHSHKASGPSEITAEMIKVLKELGADWHYRIILNSFQVN